MESHSLENDVKPQLFGKDALFEPQENFVPQINSRLETTELKLFEQNDGQKSSPDSPHSENDSDRPDSESGKSRTCIFRSFEIASFFMASFLGFPCQSS